MKKFLATAIAAIIFLNIFVILPSFGGINPSPWYEKYRYFIAFGVLAITAILVAILHFTELWEYIEE